MLNLIIADDEPLVCIGLQSMIPWARLNLKLAGTASNGQEALQLIKRLQPDIVISDIKMPVMDGLSIAREIRSQKLPQPQFIFITSYEDFHYVKDALQLEAVDYLLKMELTPASLEACLNRARERLNQQRQQKAWPASAAPDNWGNLREKFVLRLLYHLFPSKEQYEYQRQALNIHPDASTVYAAVSCWIDQPGVQAIDPHKLPDLYHACLQMASNCLKPRLNAIFCGLDLQSFAIVLLLNEAQQQQRQEQVCAALKQMGHVLHSYFNVRLTIVLGPQINDLYQINQSFIYARSYVPQDTAAAVTLIDIPARSPDQQPQDISAWREQLRRAFEELDAAALTELIDQLTLELRSDQIPLSSAVDLAASILYMALNLLPNGQDILRDSFAGDEEGYRRLYRSRSLADVINWLQLFSQSLYQALSRNYNSYSHQVVNEVKAYIRQHLRQKLTLNAVASAFNFSSNYLSHLFSREGGPSFVEYITECKVSAAKESLLDGRKKVYEIAQELGFDSAFYFSKVFKKATGYAPRDYVRLAAKSAGHGPADPAAAAGSAAAAQDKS